MALRDIFKRKSKEKIKEIKAKERDVKAGKPIEAPTQRIKKEVKTGEAWKFLKFPHVTEKATDLTKKNQYIFKIFSRANKTEIKKAIESLYGVDVISVRIVKIPPKKRRLGRISGWRKGYKKAIVKIKEGEKIEVLPR